MYDALLLLTGKRIIRRVEVGDQHTAEGMEHLLEKESFSGWPVEVIRKKKPLRRWQTSGRRACVKLPAE